MAEVVGEDYGEKKHNLGKKGKGESKEGVLGEAIESVAKSYP